MRAITRPKKEDFDLHRILHALSDPVRLSMVCQLAQVGEDLTCSALNAGRPKSSMSFHFSTLRSAGLLWTRIEGSIHLNTLRKGEVDERFPGLLDAVLAAPTRNGRRRRGAGWSGRLRWLGWLVSWFGPVGQGPRRHVCLSRPARNHQPDSHQHLGAG